MHTVYLAWLIRSCPQVCLHPCSPGDKRGEIRPIIGIWAVGGRKPGPWDAFMHRDRPCHAETPREPCPGSLRSNAQSTFRPKDPMTQTAKTPTATVPPAILGRNPADPTGAPTQRAQVEEASSSSLQYATGASGKATVAVYRSVQDLDRGGMVLRFAIENGESSFLPTATLTPEGVDIHIAGEAEAEAMVIALQTALVQLNADRAKTVGVQIM